MVRTTKQRKTIHNVLVKYGRRLSVNEILELAGDEIARLGIATVYRNLKILQEEGQAIPVNLPGQSPRWRLNRKAIITISSEIRCDKLFEIHGCPEDMAKMLPKGYYLEEHDILLRGQCDTCTKRANSHNKPRAPRADFKYNASPTMLPPDRLLIGRAPCSEPRHCAPCTRPESTSARGAITIRPCERCTTSAKDFRSYARLYLQVEKHRGHSDHTLIGPGEKIDNIQPN